MPTSIHEGETLNITVTTEDNLSNVVKLLVDNVEVDSKMFIDKKIDFTRNTLSAGQYNISLVYGGDNTYNECITDSKTVDVLPTSSKVVNATA